MSGRVEFKVRVKEKPGCNYTARCNGKVATSTSGAEFAARAVIVKCTQGTRLNPSKLTMELVRTDGLVREFIVRSGKVVRA